MADFEKKWADNVAGRYFVDDQCIDCHACRTEAPKHFKRNETNGYSIVFNQPQSPEDEALCRTALEACPVDAIGIAGEA